MYQRWNRVVGIPDWIFMLGKSSITGTGAAVRAMIIIMHTTVYSQCASRTMWTMHFETRESKMKRLMEGADGAAAAYWPWPSPSAKRIYRSLAAKCAHPQSACVCVCGSLHDELSADNSAREFRSPSDPRQGKTFSLYIGCSPRLSRLFPSVFSEHVVSSGAVLSRAVPCCAVLCRLVPSHAVQISKICPDGVETTTYAMLAGVSNFGQSVASYAGTFVLRPFGLDTINGQCDEGCCVGEGCTCDDGCDDFSNMWRLSVLGTLMPLLTIGLNYALVPQIPMNAVSCDASQPPRADKAGQTQQTGQGGAGQGRAGVWRI